MEVDRPLNKEIETESICLLTCQKNKDKLICKWEFNTNKWKTLYNIIYREKKNGVETLFRIEKFDRMFIPEFLVQCTMLNL